MFQGDIAGALTLNPNSLLATTYLVAYPILLAVELATRRPVISSTLAWLTKTAGAKGCYIPLLLLEILIGVRNIKCGM